MPYPPYGIRYSTSSDQGTDFTAREVWQWAHDYGFHWYYHVLYHPEAAGLIESWNNPLKIVIVLNRYNLKGWGRNHQKVVYVLYQHLTYDSISLLIRIFWVQESRGGKENPLIISPSDSLRKCFLSQVP